MQIILKLTTACNLKCVYCSEGDQPAETLPEEIFFKLVDELPPLLNHIGTKDAEFLFHGGEPMLYGRDNLKRLIDYAKKNLRGFKVLFLMQTNGTLINDAWIEFFKAEEISVGVSLDGYPALHDKNRRTKSDEPTAEKILENLKLMREKNLNVGTLMVFNSPEDVDAEKLFAFIKEHELRPKIHSVVPCGRAVDVKNSAEIYDAWAQVMKKLFELSFAGDKVEIIQPLDETIDAILGAAPVYECSYNGTCGKNFICLYPDGEVGFCGRDNFSRHLTYGNLREKTLLELYESDNAKKIRARQKYLETHDCKNCSDWKLCHGGCAFEAVNFFGTLEAKYPNCAARKKLIAWLGTEGLKILKAALVREKIKRRNSIKIKKQLRGEIENLGGGNA